MKSLHALAKRGGLSIVLFVSLLASCGRQDSGAHVTVGKLDRILAAGVMPDSSMLRPAEVLFEVSGYGELNDSSLRAYAINPSITFHRQAVDSVWCDLDGLTRSLSKMKSNYHSSFPDGGFPEIYAIISPFNQSVFTADDFMYVGLNHYLGEDYAPYGYFPDYIRQRKVQSRVLPDVAEALLRRDYPYAPREEYPTVLSRLLYEGALVEAEMQLAGVSEQQALGYDDVQMAWLMQNERSLWDEMAGRKYLFSTDPQLASSLVNLAPFTSVFGQDVPGAAGRFIGHRIVNSYLDNIAITLPALLSPEFYESGTVLADSKYQAR